MDQAERNFVNAILRRESGSAISAAEFDSANKQYFPQVGDSPDVLAQKRRNREVALAGLKTEGAKAWGGVENNLVAGAKHGGAGEGNSANASKKTIAKQQYSPSRNQTRITYSDGTVEVRDGK